MTYLESIRQALIDILESAPESLILGEDILDPYGGAFKVTQGLSTRFPDKVIQTPTSESGFLGVATGLAYVGYKPIVEIMFADFITLIADIIINSASKFDWFSQGQMSGDIIIRTPVGGRRGYGPIHSQSLEKLYLGWPQVALIAPNVVSDPYQLMLETFRYTSKVKFFLENKTDYASSLLETDELEAKGFRLEALAGEFPMVLLSNHIEGESPDMTICCYGGMVRHVISAAFDLLVEDEITSVICVPTLICPLKVEPIVKFVNTTGNLICVEEGYAVAGWAAYLIAELVKSQYCIVPLNQIRIVGARFDPIPADPELERQHLPSSVTIRDAVMNLIRNPNGSN